MGIPAVPDRPRPVTVDVRPVGNGWWASLDLRHDEGGWVGYVAFHPDPGADRGRGPGRGPGRNHGDRRSRRLRHWGHPHGGRLPGPRPGGPSRPVPGFRTARHGGVLPLGDRGSRSNGFVKNRRCNATPSRKFPSRKPPAGNGSSRNNFEKIVARKQAERLNTSSSPIGKVLLCMQLDDHGRILRILEKVLRPTNSPRIIEVLPGHGGTA
jgi:hypothetical protein